MSIKLMAVGDIFLKTKSGTQNPFLHCSHIFQEADILFGNLETPVTDASTKFYKKTVSSKASFDELCSLRDSGFTLVNLANNHIYDYGVEGVHDTINNLSTCGIKHIGLGYDIVSCLAEASFTVHDTSIAFIGFCVSGLSSPQDSCYIANLNSQLILHRVSELKKIYDHIVVSFHWGIEHVFYPSHEQQELARNCIESGASVVIGHHSHMLHGIEEYANGIIFYSLGNFNYWQFDLRKTDYYNRLTAVAKISFSENDTINYDLIPMYINDDYCPKPIESPEHVSQFHNHIRSISDKLTPGIEKSWWYGEIATNYLRENAKDFIVNSFRFGFTWILSFVRWLFCNPFTIRCYVGFLKRHFRS